MYANSTRPAEINTLAECICILTGLNCRANPEIIKTYITRLVKYDSTNF